MMAFLLASTFAFSIRSRCGCSATDHRVGRTSLCNLVARSRSALELRKTQHVYVRDEFLVPDQRRRLMARLAYTSILIAVVATCASAQRCGTSVLAGRARNLIPSRALGTDGTGRSEL